MEKILKSLGFPAVLLSFVFLACNGYYGPMMGRDRGHMFGYGYGTGGLFMGIIWIVLLLVIGFGIYYLVKNKGVNTGANETPLDILKRRYAKGDITKEQYEQMKGDLK